MNVLNSFKYHLGLNENVFYVLMLCTQVFAEFSTSKNEINQSRSNADSQILISPHKCCARDRWLQHLSLEGVNRCVPLPLNIKNMSLESSRNRNFSKSGILMKPACTTSRTMEMWRRSNARDYRYFAENETVFSLVTKTYYKVLCGDYINLNDFHSNSTNYDMKSFKNLESNISGVILCDIREHSLGEKISSILSTYGLGLSNFFLAVTFYLYITTSKLRQRIQGKCILCYVAALIFGFSSYIWNVKLGENDEPPKYCFLTGELKILPIIIIKFTFRGMFIH